MYLGLVTMAAQFTFPHLTVNAAGTPKDADSAPTFRIYGYGGLLNNATGSMLPMDPSSSGGPISGATNASPIVITSANHGLSTGTRVTVQNVLGNTAANGDWQITRVDGNTFSLNGSTGNSGYTGGGTWHTTGLYAFTYTPQGANGFVGGQSYAALVTWQVAGVTQAAIHTFSIA